MKNRVINKLASQAGESIGETLVALLVSALALMMLAGAVSAAMRVVTTSKAAMDGYYQVSNAMVAQATAAPAKNGLTVKEAGSFTGSLAVSIPGLLPGGTIPPVTYWKNEQLGSVPVIAYAKTTPTSD